jgi:hypothetical protein
MTNTVEQFSESGATRQFGYPILSCLLRVAGLLGAAQPFMLVRRPY